MLQFQKKCLGKMGDVANEGRTVLFVSHNMAAILNLCRRGILLRHGHLAMSGAPREAVDHYLAEDAETNGEALLSAEPGKVADGFCFRGIRTRRPGGGVIGQIPLETGVDIEITYELAHPVGGMNVAFHLFDSTGICILSSTDVDQDPSSIAKHREPGRYQAMCHIPSEYLRPGRYYLSLSSSIPRVKVLANLTHALSFDVVDTGSVESTIAQGRQGVISPILEWSTLHIDEP